MAKQPAGKPAKATVSASLAGAKRRYAAYLADNPSARLQELGASAEPFRVFWTPWGDRSLAFMEPESLAARRTLAKVLNNVILPERLSAIYHKDSKSLEVIWTAYKLSEDVKVIIGRTFSFRFRGKTYACKFGKSSDQLLEIASHAVFLGASDTGFRNLQSFSDYVTPSKSDEEGREETSSLGEPLSFFIEKVDWNEEKTLELIRHINFYLTYYDNQSPFIVIHPPFDKSKVNPKTRYILDKFPNVIESRELNPTLLSFWAAAQESELYTSFLLHFRILEFVTGYYLEKEKLSAVRKILSSPNVYDSMPKAVDSLVAIIREEQKNETLRFVKTVTELVDEDLVWREICSNSQAFTEKVRFDGGFELTALVASVDSKANFGPQGMDNFARSLRKIRNALAHGGESQTGQVILPTVRNLSRLQPWVHLISVAAGEVVIYEHLT